MINSKEESKQEVARGAPSSDDYSQDMVTSQKVATDAAEREMLQS